MGLSAAELRERNIGLSLPSPFSVPLRLTVANEENAGHGF